jgi:SAM-dependent methyltransferase
VVARAAVQPVRKNAVEVGAHGSVVEPLRRRHRLQIKIDGDRMPLIGPDPAILDGVSLLVIPLDHPEKIDGRHVEPAAAQRGNENVDSDPALSVEFDTHLRRVVTENPREHLGEPHIVQAPLRSRHSPIVLQLSQASYRARRERCDSDCVTQDAWATLADLFVDEAYASVKGYVRTYVMHQQLLEHLPPAPATVLDVGGGAGHQSFPLAAAGYDVTLLDPSPAMLDKARQRYEQLPGDAQRRVAFVQADGEHAHDAVDGRHFDAVLCHGVLGYLDEPNPIVDQLCTCAAPGGIVSIMTGNAHASAVRPALERRWDDALASFDARTEIGVLGVPGRADTVEEISELISTSGVQPEQWYGVWLFVDWLEFSGAQLDPTDREQVAATAAVELEASRRDPYRSMSRVFHLIGRKLSG